MWVDWRHAHRREYDELLTWEKQPFLWEKFRKLGHTHFRKQDDKSTWRVIVLVSIAVVLKLLVIIFTI